jgi:hypothetical protein
MSLEVMLLFLLGSALAFAGLAMVATSLYSAVRRGEPLRGRFWAPADMFVGSELGLNRKGFVLCVVGIAVLFLALYRFAG